MPSIVCLNGPNLDRLGSRDPQIYGQLTLAELDENVRGWGVELGYDVTCHQSNQEAALIDWVHRADDSDGLIINPGAFTHSSPALGDAVAACRAPVVEVHLSNVRRRDRWRRRSFVSAPAVRSIVGRGPEGYRAALRHLANRAAWPMETVRYGPHPDHVVDLRRVGGATRGVVLIHGGFWSDAWERDTVESWAVDLAKRGLPSLNLEYRRVGSGGGAVPTTSDLAPAVDAGVAALGLTSFATVGHSAGGHLAIWAAAHHAKVADVTVAVAGIFDLEQASAAGVGDGAVGQFDPAGATSPLEGPLPQGAVALVHGTTDGVVPPAQSRNYASFLEAHGVPVTLQLVEGGHFDALDPRSPVWAAVTRRVAGETA